MTRTKDENTAYQRDRRAQLAAESRKVTLEKVEEVFDAIFPKAVVIETVREYKGVSGYHYLPGDEVIGNMTQRQRDLIMAKLPKTNARTR